MSAPTRRKTASARLTAMAAAAILITGCGGEEQGGLEGSSPGADTVVGGDVEQIELFFDDIVVSIDGTVTGPDGAEVATDWILDSDIRALAELAEPLSLAGEYIVAPVADAVDGDRVDESFTFTFEPGANPPQLVFDPDDESGVPWIAWLVAIGGVAMIAVVGRQLLASMARLRAARGAGGDRG